MKRNNTSKLLNEKQYKEIMTILGKEVKRLLESYDTDECDQADVDECGDMDECGDDVDECNESFSYPINEMAVKRNFTTKAMANVRDAASRRNFNEQWAKDVKPLSKFNDIDLKERYVAALLVFRPYLLKNGLPECPKTEEDIDKIGIFKNYAHEFLDRTGMLQDIIDLYNQCDPIKDRSRRGTTRAIKSFRNTTTPTQDFDFDGEVNKNDNADVVEPINEPEPEVTDLEQVPDNEPEIEDLDNETPEVQDLEDVDTNDNDIPPYDEVDTDAEQTDTDEIPPYDEVDTDVNDNAEDNEEVSDESDDEIDNAEIVKITNIKELTQEDFNKKSMINSFVTFNDEYILKEGKQIGFKASIFEDEDAEKFDFDVFADTFGDALYKYNIILQASLNNSSSNMYMIEVPKVITMFRKRYINTLSQEKVQEMDKKIRNFATSCFENANTLEEAFKDIEDFLANN